MKNNKVNPFASILPRYVATRRDYYARYAAGFPECYPHNVGNPLDWRKGFALTSYKRFPSANAGWSQDRKQFYTSNPENSGFRKVGSMETLRPNYRENSGWYCDSYQYETATGLVYQLPSRAGCMILVPCIHLSESGEYIFAMDESVTTERVTDEYDLEEIAKDVVMTAHRNAERYAEDAREYDAKDRAEQQIETAREEIASARTMRRKIVAELRYLRHLLPASGEGFATVCESIVMRIDDLKQLSAKAYKRIAELESNYWSAIND
jgi:hypothetical protein